MQEIKLWYKNNDGELNLWLESLIKSGYIVEQLIV